MKQTDIYTEALTCLHSILLTDHPEFQNWIDWLGRDIKNWTQRRRVAHHLRAYGDMGSFSDLPSICGNHDYIFGFLKSMCYAFGHLYGKREGISPEALIGECLHNVEQAAYRSYRALSQAIAQHLMQGDLQENLNRLQEGKRWLERGARWILALEQSPFWMTHKEKICYEWNIQTDFCQTWAGIRTDTSPLSFIILVGRIQSSDMK